MRHREIARAPRAALVALALACPSAYAHHSYSLYDRCKPVPLAGEIASIEWANPHVIIALETEAGQYRVEWLSLPQLARAHISTDSLKAGDRVVVVGSVMRDPERKVMALVREIRRPRDGWSHVRELPGDSC